MTDREKVIKGIEACLSPHDPNCDLCPYDSIDLRCRANLRDDIMALLKMTDIITCSECKFHDNEMNTAQKWCSQHLRNTMDDDWCSFAERR